MHKLFLLMAACILGLCVVTAPSSSLAKKNKGKAKPAEKSTVAATEPVCANPIDVVLSTMQCFRDEDPQCIANSYSDDFVLIHNGVPSETDPNNVQYWTYAFMFSDFSMEIDHVALIDEDQVSIRYIETLDFANDLTIDQHEHALVTVNEDCKITLWDQYGDSSEQEVAIATFRAILCQLLDVCI